MNRLLILLVFSFFFIIAKSAKKDMSVYSEIDSLLLLSRQEFLNIDLLQSIEYASNAFTLSRESDYIDGEVKSCYYIAQSLTYLGSYDKALEYLDLLNEKFYFYKDNYQLRYEIARIRGQVYDYIGLHNESKNEFQKSLAYTYKIKDEYTRNYCRSLAYDNLSVLYEKKNLDSVFYYCQLNRQLLDTIDEKTVFKNKINLYTILGGYYTHKEQYDSSRYFFNKAILIADKYQFSYRSWVYYYYGMLEMKQEQYEESLIFFYKSLENLKFTNLKNEMPAVLEKITEVYSKMDVLDSVNYYNQQHDLINSELKSAKENSIGKAVQILLKEEQRYSRDKLMRIVIVFVISFILVFTFLLYFWWRWRRKKRMLLKTKSEIVELKNKINESFEELVALLESNNPTFVSRFKEIYPEFTNNLLSDHSDLTHVEFELCAMIFLNYSSKKIAMFQYVQHRSVQTRKSRLRKKLKLKPTEDLYQYIWKFG